MTEGQVRATFERMAAKVDQQNGGDPLYQRMHGRFGESMAYQAACDLVRSRASSVPAATPSRCCMPGALVIAAAAA